MKTVTINASKAYNVHICGGLIDQLGLYTMEVIKPCTACIVSDTNVWPIYGKRAINSLKQYGFSVVSFVFDAGEEQKNGTTFLKLLNFLAENQLTRSDLLIALGGGVVGDLTGFAAACYLRGICYIQVPTSLLAMVDSSVGGKTAIDLPAGKNLAGAFYQPSLVLCDLDALSTLPRNIFIDGCAEVIKYGVLYDEALFSHLKEKGLNFDREQVISRCVALKRDVVNEDELDTGARQKLNLGHTVGHAIEACSEYKITHGQAVAIGMAIVAKSAMHAGICSTQTQLCIRNTLDAFGLHTDTQFRASELCAIALKDKKRAGAYINLILPCAIGNCIIQKTPTEDLEAFIQSGL